MPAAEAQRVGKQREELCKPTVLSMLHSRARNTQSFCKDILQVTVGLLGEKIVPQFTGGCSVPALTHIP